MANTTDNNFFILENKVELPKGTKIVSNSGLWLVHEDLPKISLYTSVSASPRVFLINDLQLVAPNDEVKTIDFIEQGQIYIFAIRDKVPTGFFIKLEEEEIWKNDDKYCQVNKSEFIEPKVLNFALDSLYFHRQILTSFVPIQGSFCIVSKEGITLHDLNFQVHFSLIQQITFCLYSENYLYVSDGIKFAIYRFDLKIYECTDESASNLDTSLISAKSYEYFFEDTTISREVLTANGYPCNFISLSSSLLLILKNTEKQSFQIQIQHFTQDDQTQRVFHDISSHISANKSFQYENILNNRQLSKSEYYVPYFIFLNYDDCLLAIDTSDSGSSILIDFTENHYTPVGSQFKLPNNIHIINVFNKDYVLCDDNCIYKLQPDYSKIKNDSLDVTAAIMRRKDGMNNAFDRLRTKLESARDNDKLKEIIKKIGPSAVDPIAQMKFTRSIQFSGISDPHLIILGLVQFSILLGDKMIDEAWIPLFECFAHSQIENLLDSAIRNGIIKLNSSSIKNLVLAFNKELHIDSNVYSVDNLIDYANAYIDLGHFKAAKIIINLAQLSDSFSEEQIEQIKKRLNDSIKKANDNDEQILTS